MKNSNLDIILHFIQKLVTDFICGGIILTTIILYNIHGAMPDAVLEAVCITGFAGIIGNHVVNKKIKKGDH